jgi:hypothetical protein
MSVSTEIINVHTGYDWTSIPRNSPYRDSAPYIKVVSYKVTSSAALNRLRSYLNLLTTSVSDFYNDLYKNTEKSDTYYFPYFGDNVRSFSNEFGDTFQNSVLGGIESQINTLGNELAIFAEAGVIGNAKAIGSNVMKKFRGERNVGFMDNTSTSPGSYIETPKMYVYGQTDSSLDISFPLYNTINEDAWQTNYDLIEKLTTINRPTRLSPITMDQPYLYEITLPGIRYIRWAFCGSFSVNLLGARRIIENKIIPDGYQINMSFTSLTTEVNNFIEASKGNGISNPLPPLRLNTPQNTPRNTPQNTPNPNQPNQPA